MIKINDKTISSIYSGEKVIEKVFKGTLQVYEGWKNLIVSGVTPLTLSKCKGVDLVDYKIYGNSIQNGTPTPDTPIEVESVGDKSINICPSFCSQYPTEGTMKVHKFPIKANTTYSIGFGSEKTAYKAVWLYDNNDNITKLVTYAYGDSGYNNMVVIPKQDGYMSVGIMDSSANVIVAEGMYYTLSTSQQNNLNNNGITTSARGEIPYEPYGVYIVPIVSKSKNLYGGEREFAYSKTTNNTHKSFYEAFKIGKQYTLYCYIDNTQATGTACIRMSVGIKGGGWIYNQSGSITAGNKGYSRTVFTIPDNYNGELNMQFQANGGTVIFADIMLVEGKYNLATLPEYEPYYEPVTTNIYLNEPLRKIGDYVDYIDFKNKKVVRNIKQKMLDGNVPVLENGDDWRYVEGYYLVAYASSEIPDIYKTRSKGYILCDRLVNRTYTELYSTTNVNEGISTYNTSTYSILIRLKNNNITTKEKYYEYLNNNPLDILYVLATPTEETIELPNIPTHKGTTIIEIDTKIQPSNMEVIYKGKR